MATERASGGLDHLTAVPENFEPDPAANRGEDNDETDPTERSAAAAADRTAGRTAGPQTGSE